MKIRTDLRRPPAAGALFAAVTLTGAAQTTTAAFDDVAVSDARGTDELPLAPLSTLARPPWTPPGRPH